MNAMEIVAESGLGLVGVITAVLMVVNLVTRRRRIDAAVERHTEGFQAAKKACPLN